MKPARYLLLVLLFIAGRAEAVIGPISGPARICSGNAAWLSDTTAGGLWTSGDTAKATIDSVSGLLIGKAAGTLTITYTVKSGSYVTAPLIIDPHVSPIAGYAIFCSPGYTATYSDATPGGTWSSRDTSTVAIDSLTGLANIKKAGSVTISYTLGACSAALNITVRPTYDFGGCDNLGVGDTMFLPFASGTYIISTDPAAQVIGQILIGKHVGTTTVMAINPSTGCADAKKKITITSLALVKPIAGNKPFCNGNSISLSDAVLGGIWKTDDTTIAKVNSSGLLTGLKAGWTPITYSIFGASCADEVIVNDLPKPITGPTSFCVKDTVILASSPGNVRVQNFSTTYYAGGPILIDGPWLPGGIFSSSDTTIARVRDKYSYNDHVIGLSAGTATISYTDTYTGCYTTKPITVNGTPALSTIIGLTTICAGTSATLSDTVVGGIWSCSDTGIAKINPVTGMINAIKTGTLVVRYSAGNSCGIASVFDTITVIGPPSSGIISGRSIYCVGDTTTLVDTTGSGIWSSSDTSVAKIGSIGYVTALKAGTAIISYTTANSCGRTTAVTTITVNPLPTPIIGPSTICTGFTVTMSDASGPGIWSIGNTLLATVGSSTGIVTGWSAGTPTITFTNATTGCYITRVVTILNPPSTLIGPATVCKYSSPTYLSYPSGGAWSTGNTSIATINAGTGQMIALTPGTTTVTYTLAGTCFTIAKVTVVQAPVPITGPSSVCVGGNIFLSDATPGGTWSATNTCVATGTGGGVTGISAVPTNTATIAYTLPNTCAAFTTVTVVSLVPPIMGITSLCAGSLTTCSDALTGGVWSSANTNISVLTPMSGTITGKSAGTSVISYTLRGCSSSMTITVDPLPAVITGVASICAPMTTIFSDTTIGGVWTSDNTSVAMIAPGGVTTASAAGTATISYTIKGTGCASSINLVVSIPTILTGGSTICAGDTSLLSASTGGGTWSSSNTGIATVNSVGVVKGTVAGTSIISYASGTACSDVRVTVTVMPAPAPGLITGIMSLCMGDTATLHDATRGGLWNSSDLGVATITSAGHITTISPGTSVISYTLSNSCGSVSATGTLAVNAIPVIDSSSIRVCAGSIDIITGLVGAYWNISDTSIAIVNKMSGVINAVAYGSSVISFTSIAGCSSAIPIMVDSINTPSVHIVGYDDSVCAGTMTLLKAISTNEGVAPHFKWAVNGASIGTDSDTLLYMPGGSDTALVTLTSDARCASPVVVSSPAVFIPVIYTPVPSVTMSSSSGYTLIKGIMDTLSATITNGGAAPVYQWYINHVLVAGATSSVFICDSMADNDTVLCGVISSDRCNPEGYDGIIFHVIKPDGIRELQSKSQPFMYPNPANESITIADLAVRPGKVFLTISDLLGRIVLERTISISADVDKLKVDIKELTAGRYILSLRSLSSNYIGKLMIEK